MTFKRPLNPTAIVFCLLAILTLPLVAASKSEPTTKSPLAAAKKGDVLYTKFSLFYEKEHHITTNYRKGMLLPVNSEVIFQKATSSKISLLVHGNQKLTIENVRDYSGEDLDGIFERTLSKTKVDLGQFSKSELAAIQQGVVVEGMSKGAVVVALGYPPKHKTPTLEGDKWRYWRNRNNTFVVHFRDGKVTAVQN